MSDLRSRIAMETEIAYHDGDRDWLDVADAALAAVREALLSDAAVGAGITGEARVLGLQDTLRIEWEPVVRKTVTAALAAALDAAGITEGADDE